jgi:hypothetical protein
MKAIDRPLSEPHFSCSVSRSASAWQGCSSFVRALMTGMPEKLAYSSTIDWP